MSHSSSLKARRKRQRIKKLLDVEAKRDNRMAKEAKSGPKKVRVSKEKVKAEKAAPETAKKPKPAEGDAGKKAKKAAGDGA